MARQRWLVLKDREATQMGEVNPLAHHGVRPEDLPDELIDALGAHLLPHSVTATPLSLSTSTFCCTLRRL